MYGYYGYGMWLAKEKGTHRLIGRAGIDYRMLGEEEIIEMGYVIAPEYQRQGYAYEVCQAIMAWAKSNLDFRRIISPPPPLAQSTAVSLKQPFDGYYLLII